MENHDTGIHVTDVFMTTHRCAAEMKKFCKVNIAADGKETFGAFKGIPAKDTWTCSDKSKYLVLCANETIEGVEFKEDPLVEGKTLIADVSSNFLSKPINISNYGVSWNRQELLIQLVLQRSNTWILKSQMQSTSLKLLLWIC